MIALLPVMNGLSHIKVVIVVCVFTLGFSTQILSWQGAETSAETRAIEFLMKEVPSWKRKNGCYSCHNNGDAARALYKASQKGYRIPGDVLNDTTLWLSKPRGWDENKGDPGFSDKRLADIQFGASLLTAIETGHIKDRSILKQAAEKLVTHQEINGSFVIDAGNMPGSPATLGTHLATLMVAEVLKEAGNVKESFRKAEKWLDQVSAVNLQTAAVVLITTHGHSGRSAAGKRDRCISILRTAQTSVGGWGPYSDSPPEVFDTAIALIALSGLPKSREIDSMVRRGRSYLITQQNPDGSWPATTRPSGGDSYAQLMSTTGWATLALLETGR